MTVCNLDQLRERNDFALVHVPGSSFADSSTVNVHAALSEIAEHIPRRPPAPLRGFGDRAPLTR
jgi:hypothetical protein